MKKLVSILAIIIIIISCNGYAFFNKTVYAEDGEGTTDSSNEPTTEPTTAPTTSEPEPEPQPEPEPEKQPEVEPTEATKTESEPTTAPAKTNNSTTKSTNNKNTTTAKSSNANLSDLGIKPKEYDFKGFKSGTTSYSVEVENSVTEVEVYAKAQDTKAKISGTGKKTLQEGNNALEVIVTAENGTKKTYTINVTRKASTEEKEEKPQEEKKEEKVETKEVKGLSELKIAGIEMSPKFNPEVYTYTVNYTGTDTKLDITTKVGDANSTVEITGNENLVEGDNLINILVTDKDGKIYTYQVTVKKSLANPKETFSIKNIIIIAVVGVGLLGIGIFVVKKIRNRNNIEEDSEDYEEEIEKIEEFEKNNKKAYVNSILQTSVDEEDEKEVVQQDSWFKKEIEKEKNEGYGGPIIYEPEDHYSELKIEKPVKKKGRAKGKRFK